MTQQEMAEYWAARRADVEAAYQEFVRAYAALHAPGAGPAEIDAAEAASVAYTAAWAAAQE